MKTFDQLFQAIEHLNKTPREKILSMEELQELQKVQYALQNSQDSICRSLERINQLKPMEDFNFEFLKTNSSLYNSDLVIEDLAHVYLEYAKCIRVLVRVDDLICKLWTKYSDHLPIQEKHADA